MKNSKNPLPDFQNLKTGRNACYKASSPSAGGIYGIPSITSIFRSVEAVMKDKAVQRRTRVMESVTGEIACYRTLAYISLKMEMTLDFSRR